MLFKKLHCVFGRLLRKVQNRSKKLLITSTLLKKIIYIEFV